MSMVKSLEPQIATLPEHIIHFGAGSCNELEYYLQSSAKQITLVEADPLICKRLYQRVNGQQNLQVINAAVAAANAEATLYVYNLPAVSSLREATGLFDIFPGLKLKTKIPLTTITPGELLQPLELDSQQPNWLTIDTPGEELAILQALNSSGYLDYFSLLNVYCGTGIFYQGSTDVHTLLQQLQSWGYEILSKDNQDDPDRPCWTLQRNPLFLELTNARQKQGELQQALDDANKAKAEYEEQSQKLKQQLNAADKAREEQQKLVSDREQMLAQLTATRGELEQSNREQQKLQQALDDANKAKAEHEQQILEIKQQLNAADKAHEEQQKLVSEREQMLAQLTATRKELEQSKREQQKLQQALDDANKAKAEHEQQILEIKQQLNTADKAHEEQRKKAEEAHRLNADKLHLEIKTLKQEIVRERQTASVSVKMLALKEKDLNDLQQRYKKAVAVQDQQHQLLTKIGERLYVAADYFHELEVDDMAEEIKELAPHLEQGSSDIAGSHSKSKSKS